MTIKRAIKILHPNIPAKIDSLAETEIAHKMAVETLEKQAPKEPILKAMDGFDFDVAAELCCPRCSNPTKLFCRLYLVRLMVSFAKQKAVWSLPPRQKD